MLAGSLLALGLWNLFNLLFVGGALTAIDSDELDNAHAFGIGTGIGSVLAPLIAMFIGGLVAGRMAAHYDRRVNAGHGALVWAITSVLGLVIMANVANALVDDDAMGYHDMAPPAAGTGAYVDDQVRFVNQHLKAQGAPQIETDDLLDASRYAAGDGKAINKDAFVSRLDANTDLSRPEAEAVLTHLGDRAPDVIFASQQLALHKQQAMEAAEDTGKALLAAGGALFLCLVTATAGALIGGRMLRNNNGNRMYDRPDTIPGHPATAASVTTPGPNVVVDPDLRRDPLE